MTDYEKATKENDEINVVESSGQLFSLTKNTKRWRSMYALRDSIRNLTSCVSSRSNFAQKKNVPIMRSDNSNSNSKLNRTNNKTLIRKNENFSSDFDDSDNDNGGFDNYNKKVNQPNYTITLNNDEQPQQQQSNISYNEQPQKQQQQQQLAESVTESNNYYEDDDIDYEDFDLSDRQYNNNNNNNNNNGNINSDKEMIQLNNKFNSNSTTTGLAATGTGVKNILFMKNRKCNDDDDEDDENNSYLINNSNSNSNLNLSSKPSLIGISPSYTKCATTENLYDLASKNSNNNTNNTKSSIIVSDKSEKFISSSSKYEKTNLIAANTCINSKSCNNFDEYSIDLSNEQQENLKNVLIIDKHSNKLHSDDSLDFRNNNNKSNVVVATAVVDQHHQKFVESNLSSNNNNNNNSSKGGLTRSFLTNSIGSLKRQVSKTQSVPTTEPTQTTTGGAATAAATISNIKSNNPNEIKIVTDSNRASTNYKHSKSSTNFIKTLTNEQIKIKSSIDLINTSNVNINSNNSSFNTKLIGSKTSTTLLNSATLEPKIKIKRKKAKTSSASNSNSNSSPNNSKLLLNNSSSEDQNEKDVLDMIEKVQSNGFDDQRYKHSLPSSSATEFLNKFPIPSSNKDSSKNEEHLKLITTTISSSSSSSASKNYKKLNLDLGENNTKSDDKSKDISVTTMSNNNSSSTYSFNSGTNNSNTNNNSTIQNGLNSPRTTTAERLNRLLNRASFEQQNEFNNNNDLSETSYISLIKKNDCLLPMISLPNNDNYWSEGWKNDTINDYCINSPNNDLVIVSSSSSSSASTTSSSSASPSSSSPASPLSSASSSPSPTLSSSNQSNNNNNKQNSKLINNASWQTPNITTMFDFDLNNDQIYRDAFVGKEHLIFYGSDINDQPLVLSYKTELVDSVEYLKAILRARETNYCMTVALTGLDETVTPTLICRTINPDIKIKFLHPIAFLNGFKLIQNFDNHTGNKNFKFGVIYMKKGQTTEEELFSNQEHSESFDKFLGVLGKRIKLKDHQGFRGGLDTVNGQTGEYSVYEVFQNREIMFHVSTLLPYSKTDSQQLERKRHIGNDIVAIVFQEDNTPFAPDMIASNFLHAFLVVQKFIDPITSKLKFRVSVTARKDVPNFGPPITNDSIYENDSSFKEWILNKLINAELACLKAEKFRKLNERTRSAYLDSLYTSLHDQNQRVLQSLFPNVNLSIPDDQNNNNNSNHQHHHHHHFLSSSHSGNDHNHSNNYHSLSSRVITDQNSRLYGDGNLSSTSLLSATNHNGSTTNLSGSSSTFRFNLLNTVKKAFKKESKDSLSSSSNKAIIANRSATSSTLPYNPITSATTPTSNTIKTIESNKELSTMENSNNNNSSSSQYDLISPTKSRVRSSTFDSGASFNSTTSLLSRQQPPKKHSKSEKGPKVVDHHLQISKIGSIDSLNNIENYSALKQTNININNNNNNNLLLSQKNLNSNNIHLFVPNNGKHKSIVLNTLNEYSSSNSRLNHIISNNNSSAVNNTSSNYDKSSLSSPDEEPDDVVDLTNEHNKYQQNGLNHTNSKSNLILHGSKNQNLKTNGIEDSDTGMGSLTPNSSGLSSNGSASATEFYSNINNNGSNLTDNINPITIK